MERSNLEGAGIDGSNLEGIDVEGSNLDGVDWRILEIHCADPRFGRNRRNCTDQRREIPEGEGGRRSGYHDPGIRRKQRKTGSEPSGPPTNAGFGT